MGSARTASARGRAAQLFAGFAHRGARLIDDADPEHDAVIDTVRGRQCAVLNFPSAELVLFARRVVFGSDYEDGGVCIPPRRAQSAPAETARQGFKVPRARSESFPNAAEIGRKIEFLTVNAGFGPS